MGFYINPPDGTKEKWLDENGIMVDPPPFWLKEKDLALVCLMDNGPFMAAAVCFSRQELAEFSRDDGRVKFWYLVEKKKLVDAGALKMENFQD